MNELEQTMELYQAWYRRALRAERALEFYAKPEHWMAPTENGPRTSLVALSGDLLPDGWSVAKRALRR